MSKPTQEKEGEKSENLRDIASETLETLYGCLERISYVTGTDLPEVVASDPQGAVHILAETLGDCRTAAYRLLEEIGEVQNRI